MYSLQYLEVMTSMPRWLVYFDLLRLPIAGPLMSFCGVKQNWFRAINNVPFSVEETSLAVNCKMRSLQYFNDMIPTNDSFISIRNCFFRLISLNHNNSRVRLQKNDLGEFWRPPYLTLASNRIWTHKWLIKVEPNWSDYNTLKFSHLFQLLNKINLFKIKWK